MAKIDTRITNTQVWALAGPMIISNLSVPLVGAVDTAVVGRLPGPEYIGGVAIGALIFSFIYWGFGFLRMGTTGYIARAKGAGSYTEIGQILLRVLMLALFLGLIISMIGRPLIDLALTLVKSTQEVEILATDYSYIRIWSAPATLFIYVFTGFFIGLHNTRLALLLQLALNISNVALDLLFVPVLELGVAGVAWATLISEYLAAALGFWLLRKQLRIALTAPNWQIILAPSKVIDLLRTNSHIFVRTLCLVFSFALFTAQGARLGELVLAANAILLHLQSMMAYGLDGFAHAAEALAGSAYGERNKSRFKQAVRITTRWSLITALFIGLIYLFFGSQLLSLFSNQQSVLTTAHTFLPWMIVAPLISVWSFQLDGIFIGIGHTREMRNAMIASTLGYLLLVWILLPIFGNHGLFLALLLFMVLRAGTLWLYYPAISQRIESNIE